MIARILISILDLITPCLVRFIVQFLKHQDKKDKEMREGERERAREKNAQQKQEEERGRKEEEHKKEARRKKEKRERKAQKEREKKAQEEREKQTQHKRDEEWERERELREAQHKEEKKQRRAKKEEEKNAREEKERQTQQKRGEEWERLTQRFDKLEEELERETRERREGERKLNQRYECLMKRIRQAVKMFQHFWRCQHGYSYACRTYGGYQTFEELLATSGLIEEFGNDDEQELRAIFNASIQGNSYVGASSSSPSSNSSMELALVEIPEQFPEGYENDLLSLVATAMHGETLPTEAGNAESKQYYDALREKGNSYFKDKNFTEAIECYTLSIDQSPTAAAYANRALAYIKLNKFAEAEKDCTKALKIDCRYFKAYAKRAMARKERGLDLKGALCDVNEALKLESGDQDMKALRSELSARLSFA